MTSWPPWVVMWSLAFAIFCACKGLTWRREAFAGTSLGRRFGYLAAWPGLDAAAFLNPHPNPSPAKPAPREWLFALGKFVLGVGLFYGVARWIPPRYPRAAAWVGMAGIVMTLHFGVFHLLSCAWRRAGVDAKPLMNRPLVSVSLAEFWGRRWNIAFRDMTHRFLFRPLTARLGARWAVLVGFLVSGLIHDVVISWPAWGGYGGPTLYFLIQGLGLPFERSRFGRRLGLGSGWRGRLFTMATLVGPVTLLFHRPFVVEVVTPFMRAAGALE